MAHWVEGFLGGMIPPDWDGYVTELKPGLVNWLLGRRRVKLDRWGDPVLKANWKPLGGSHPQLWEVVNSMAHNRCFFCGQSKLLDGPQGPGAVMVVCETCGAQFNDGGFTVTVLRGPTDPIPERINGIEGKPAASNPDLSNIDLEGLIKAR